ncbi:MAG: hypothetical protein OQK12_05435 [Motiliproteus sp.]|nr:hypothetical protein [Motiliproteus sp.]MCW9052845.1 hypothetical protein [Motiliproteus sp.]
MEHYCHSCGVPLTSVPGSVAPYCSYCADEPGVLKPRVTVKAGIAQWLASWQPGLDEVEAEKRAECYMQSMPAWAQHQHQHR